MNFFTRLNTLSFPNHYQVEKLGRIVSIFQCHMALPRNSLKKRYLIMKKYLPKIGPRTSLTQGLLAVKNFRESNFPGECYYLKIVKNKEKEGKIKQSPFFIRIYLKIHLIQKNLQGLLRWFCAKSTGQSLQFFCMRWISRMFL